MGIRVASVFGSFYGMDWADNAYCPFLFLMNKWMEYQR